MTSTAQGAGDEGRAVEDARLLGRMASGDRHALAALYDRFSRPLYSTALHMLRDPAEAQDLTHDVFLILWEKSAAFEQGKGTAFSWAVTLLRNRAIDRLRSRRRRSRILEEAAPADLGYDAEGALLAVEEGAAAGDEAREVRAAVAALPAEQRAALDLAFFKGLTQQEIARQLKEPLGTVKARIRRGLQKMRESLARCL
jgi:RNA polymerase sigma-70 factor (ECF subfamily)